MPADREEAPVHEPGDDFGAGDQAEDVAEGPEEQQVDQAHRAERVGRAERDGPARRARRRGGRPCTSPVYEAVRRASSEGSYGCSAKRTKMGKGRGYAPGDCAPWRRGLQRAKQRRSGRRRRHEATLGGSDAPSVPCSGTPTRSAEGLRRPRRGGPSESQARMRRRGAGLGGRRRDDSGALRHLEERVVLEARAPHGVGRLEVAIRPDARILATGRCQLSGLKIGGVPASVISRMPTQRRSRADSSSASHAAWTAMPVAKSGS